MTAVGAQEPEVFVVYRVFEYKDKGLIFSHAGSTGEYGLMRAARGASEKSASCVRPARCWRLQARRRRNGTWRIYILEIPMASSMSKASIRSISRENLYDNVGRVASRGSNPGHDVSNVIGEVLVFDSKLSDSDRASVRQRLMSKWDVPTPDRRWRWVSDGNVTAGSDASGSDQFGHSVSVSGDTMVIGAPYDDDNNRDQSGSVYVFTRSSNGVWTQQQKLTAGSDA